MEPWGSAETRLKNTAVDKKFLLAHGRHNLHFKIPCAQPHKFYRMPHAVDLVVRALMLNRHAHVVFALRSRLMALCHVSAGDWLLIDDANFCSPSVLDRLNALLEPHGVLSVTERGLIDGKIVEIKPHPNFRLIERFAFIFDADCYIVIHTTTFAVMIRMWKYFARGFVATAFEKCTFSSNSTGSLLGVDLVLDCLDNNRHCFSSKQCFQRRFEIPKRSFKCFQTSLKMQ